MKTMWIDKLVQMKKESGMTLDDIIIKSKVSKGTLNKIFAGQTKDPQLSSIKAIVHALGYTLDDLDNLIENPPTPAKAETEELDENEKQLIKNYRSLNDDGKTAAIDHMEYLVTVAKYKKCDNCKIFTDMEA